MKKISFLNCPKLPPSNSKSVKGTIDIISSESDISDLQRYPLNLWSSKDDGYILLTQDRAQGVLRLQCTIVHAPERFPVTKIPIIEIRISTKFLIRFKGYYCKSNMPLYKMEDHLTVL